MELYLKVGLACSEGMSRRQAAKHFNISRDSVAKMLTYSTPPGYQRQSPIRRPKLDAFVSTIDLRQRAIGTAVRPDGYDIVNTPPPKGGGFDYG